jgi:peptidoglycan/xylan/chitin deacetylase (PgdA/CDA1 family)
VPLRKLRRQAREVLEVPRDLVLGRYPPFVTGGGLPRGHVPVFVFHSLEESTFGRKVEYLARNGYVTLSGTEYFQFLMGTKPAPPKAVVLTFDDGRGSLWTVGLPVLRRFGMQGIVFLVPGRTASRPGPPAATLDDVHQGRARPEAIPDREKGAATFLSWEEIETMARSGQFEFHSHTLTHARIHTRPEVVGFLTPEMREGYAAMDVPVIAEDGRDLFADAVPLGTPLLRSEPRTSESLRFFEDPSVRTACVRAVGEEGESFFRRKDWRARLRRRLGRSSIGGRFETPDERERAIRHELLESKRLIEEHTGRPAVHLCYPWHVSGPTTRRLAREAGYRTAFCGKVPGTPITLAGGDPHAVARVGEDYVELLPGDGRADIGQVLRKKWRRRLRGA